MNRLSWDTTRPARPNGKRTLGKPAARVGRRGRSGPDPRRLGQAAAHQPVLGTAAAGRTTRRPATAGLRHAWRMATMRDLDELALELPETTKEVSDDGRPAYLVHGKAFCLHRGRRPTRSMPQPASASTTS